MSVASKVKERLSLRTAQVRAMVALALSNVMSRRPAVAAGGPVVSLTSYGKRARTVGFTLESIAQGTLLPSRLLLWLDEPELIARLPASVRRLQARGLEVLPCENYGPHKKYYPYVAAQTTLDAPLVTADDDVLYPRDWLASLMAAHQREPELVHCYRARVMALSGSELLPYASWPDCSTTAPSHRHFSVGLAGVLFPAHVQRELQHSGASFTSSCPRTDDIWLNLHAQRAGARARGCASCARGPSTSCSCPARRASPCSIATCRPATTPRCESCTAPSSSRACCSTLSLQKELPRRELLVDAHPVDDERLREGVVVDAVAAGPLPADGEVEQHVRRAG